MDFEIIWRKIQEFAMWFFHFAMNEGENKFMLVDQNLLRVDKINSQTMTMYFGAFLIILNNIFFIHFHLYIYNSK